jgi:uncharacterized protein with PIN domain
LPFPTILAIILVAVFVLDSTLRNLLDVSTMNKLMRKIRRWSKRSKILAVSDDGLEKLLTSLGILDRLKRGEMRCFVCKRNISADSIQMVSRVKGEIVVVCDKPECVYSFAQEQGKA